MSFSKELLPLEGSKNDVWKHFGFPAKDGKFVEANKKNRTEVFCKVCLKCLKYCGNTTNLHFHLKEHHRSIYSSLAVQAGSSRKKEVNLPNQLRIAEAIAATQKLPQSSTRWNKLTDSMCYFIAKDMQPLDTVDDRGFRHLVHSFEPRYDPPSRKTLTTKYLPQLFEGEKANIKHDLSGIRSFSLTTDIWTSRANHAYTGLTIHFINDQFELLHYLLETKEFPDSHTSPNIASELTDILKEWGLSEDDVSAITTDNGRNIIAAIRELGWKNLLCFSHTLQLGVVKVLKLPQVTRTIARCKRIATHFHHSSKSTYILKEKQKSLGFKDHSIIQDVATRWNSSYYMISRIMEQQQPICATLLEIQKTNLMPSDQDFKTMEDFVAVMKPLVDITEAVGGDKWVTISTLRPILHKLLHTHFVPVANDSQLIKSMKRVLSDDLNERYKEDTLPLLTKACFLDPRFKNLKFLSETSREEVKIDLKLDVDVLSRTESSATSLEPPPKKSKGEHKLMEFIGEMVGSNEEGESLTSLEDQLDIEISRYMGEEHTHQPPLLWWNSCKGRYPLLVQLAKKYLAIPATSVPCERVFSAAGHVVNEKRSCLLPTNVNMLVFLAENLK